MADRASGFLPTGYRFLLQRGTIGAMNKRQITAHCDNFGHWSTHFAGQPWLAFGGDTPQTAAIRLLIANPESPHKSREPPQA